MKKKNITYCLQVLYLAALVTLIQTSIALAESSNVGREPLQEKEELIARKRQHIEDRYARRLIVLRDSAEQRAKREFRYPRRILWSEFLKMLNQTPTENRYFLTQSFLEHKTYKLRDAMMKDYSVYSLGTLLLDENARRIVAHIESSGNYDRLMRTEARRLLAVMDELKSKLLRLHRQKEYELAQLEQEEKELKEGLLRVRRAEKVQPKTPQRGVVSAICHGKEGRLVMVDDKIVYEGESIKDVKILKIYVDRVEFEKNGKAWVQKLGEEPKAFWQ